MAKPHWINLPKFWKWGSVVFLVFSLGYLAFSLLRGFGTLDLIVVLLGVIAAFVMQTEYLLFKYLEHERIDAKEW